MSVGETGVNLSIWRGRPTIMDILDGGMTGLAPPPDPPVRNKSQNQRLV